MLVTVGGMDGTQPPALFQRGADTVLAVLVKQLRDVAAGADIEVLAPEWAAESIRAQLPSTVAVTGCRTIRIALNEVIRHAYEAIARGDEVALVDGGLVAHNAALAAVLAGPVAHTSLLVGERALGPGVRTAEDIVVSAGSSAHAVTSPNQDALGVLRIVQQDMGALAEAARGISTTGRVSDTAGDLIDLLIVGLVRLGTRVAAVPLGPYVLYLPQTQLEVGAALVDLLEVDEDRLRLAGTARADDGAFATLVGRRLSRPITRWALRHRIDANQVTLASLGVAFVAALAFVLGNRVGLVIGAILVQAAYVLGCADGEIARYTRQLSQFGGWLDAVSERVKEYLIYAGLAVGAVQAGDALPGGAIDGATMWGLAGSMLAVHACRQMVDAGFAVRHAEWQAEEAPEPLSLPLNRRDDVPVAAPAPAHATTAEPRSEQARDRMPFSVARGAVEWLEHTDRITAMVWLRRALAMPVGERWFVISVGAAFFGPREVFIALLATTGAAVVYMTIGRLLRSMAHA